MCKDKNNTLCKICTESMVGGWIKNHHEPGFCYDCSKYLFLKDIIDPIVFHHYIDCQLEEITKNSYYMAERLHCNVSMNEAAMDFVARGYAKTFHDEYSQHYKLIRKYFTEFPKAIITSDLVEILLGHKI